MKVGHESSSPSPRKDEEGVMSNAEGSGPVSAAVVDEVVVVAVGESVDGSDVVRVDCSSLDVVSWSSESSSSPSSC